MIEFGQYQTTTLTITLKEVLEMLVDKYPDKFKGNESVTGKIAFEKHDWGGPYHTSENICDIDLITLTVRTKEV
jgi:hypothetical protein